MSQHSNLNTPIGGSTVVAPGPSGVASVLGTQVGLGPIGVPPGERHSGPGPRLMTASTLTGDKVMNQQDETLGEIDQIMLDVPRGKIAYAVMSVGGFLGMGERLLAVPWQALRLDTVDKCFRLDADKARIENAPGFDKDRWPDMADTRWATDLHSYYGTKPYWDI
jgi:sporulation protein YlmC with PRC-barrel domain